MTTDDYAVAASLTEKDADRQRQQEFREQLKANAVIEVFSTPHEVLWKVIQAIRNWEYAQPKPRELQSQFQQLVTELNRRSNLPHEVQLDEAAANAALAERNFEKARQHLTQVAEATRRSAEFAVREAKYAVEAAKYAIEQHARALAHLGALALTERDYVIARKQYGAALALTGLPEERLTRYRRSYVVASNAVIASAALLAAGRKVLNEMVAAGATPDEVTYTTLINLAKDYTEGRKVLDEMVAAGARPNEVTYTTLINLAKDYTEGRKVLDEMVAAGARPNEVTYNTLINLAKDYTEGRKVLDEMVAAGATPDEVTYTTLINLAKDYTEGRKVLDEMVAAGARPNEVTYNTLINLAKDYTEGRKVLIGIGGRLATPPLPHHRAYGSRTTAVRPS